MGSESRIPSGNGAHRSLCSSSSSGITRLGDCLGHQRHINKHLKGVYVNSLVRFWYRATG